MKPLDRNVSILEHIVSPGSGVAHADVRQGVDFHRVPKEIAQQLPPDFIGEGVGAGAGFLGGTDENPHPAAQGKGRADHLLVARVDHLKPPNQDSQGEGLFTIQFDPTLCAQVPLFYQNNPIQSNKNFPGEIPGKWGYTKVAAMTALMVCIRFSASSKTMD